MSEAVLVALITAGATVGVQLMIFFRSRNDTQRQMDQTVALIEQRLNQLEEKQDKHNGLIERMTKVEVGLKSAHKRIDEIHHEHWEELL